VLLLLLATATTEVPRVVGKHPGTLPVVLASLALFVAIVAAGFYASNRSKRGGG